MKLFRGNFPENLLRKFLPNICDNYFCLIKFQIFATAGLQHRYFPGIFKNILKIPVSQETSKKPFTRKMFYMYVYCVKWLSYKGRHVEIKGEEFSALYVEGNS